MVFPYGCIDIIFRKDVLVSKGLLQKVLERYKPKSESIDDKLVLVPCAMSSYVANDEINWLKENFGLTYIQDYKAIDFVVVEGFMGPCVRCDWIDFLSFKEDTVIEGKVYKKHRWYYEYIEENKLKNKKYGLLKF